MKSGASDPFAEEDEEAAASDAGTTSPTDEESAAGETASGRTTATAASTAATDQSSTDDVSGVAEDAGSNTDDASGAEGISRDELPFVLRRDKVKDERPEVHQLFVRQSTHERAVDAERDLEDRLDADLSRTDAREAIYLAGMENLDRASAILREWGYDL